MLAELLGLFALFMYFCVHGIYFNHYIALKVSIDPSVPLTGHELLKPEDHVTLNLSLMWLALGWGIAEFSGVGWLRSAVPSVSSQSH